MRVTLRGARFGSDLAPRVIGLSVRVTDKGKRNCLLKDRFPSGRVRKTNIGHVGMTGPSKVRME